MQLNDTDAKILLHVLKKYGSIELPASGNSMYPLIKDGDICKFTTCDPSKLTKGDIVLFLSCQGKLLAHRFYRVTTVNNLPYFIFKGDTNLATDTPITEEYILAKLKYIKRGKDILSINNLLYLFWGKIIQSLPQLGYWIRKIKKNQLRK